MEDITFTQRVGRNIKHWRLRRGITKAELGKCAELRTKIPAMTIDDFEKGREIPRISDIEKIATVLFVDTNDLLGYTVSMLDD